MSYLCQIDNAFALRLVNEASRVTTFGEVFTPPKFVNQLLDLLDKKAWSDPKTVLVENTCGDGAFVIPILRRRFAGLTNKHRTPQAVVAIAVSTVWGTDLQADNVDHCRANVMRAVLAHLYAPGVLTSRVAKDIEFIAAIAAAIEHQIRVGDGLKFRPREETTFLMLPREVQIKAADRQLTLLHILLDGKMPSVETWLATVFRPAARLPNGRRAIRAA